jgi:uncharacterized protein YfbU (UPF0304 family)
MQLDQHTRLILLNQYEILKHLDPDNAEDYDQKQEILRSGYQLFYSELDGSIAEGDGLTPEECRFVLDVLDVYGLLTDYRRKNPGDTAVATHRWAIFPGFDGNNETELMGFARFLIVKQGKFAYVDVSKGFNSHMPTVDKYRKMVAMYRAKIAGHGLGAGGGLTGADYLAILNAQLVG